MTIRNIFNEDYCNPTGDDNPRNTMLVDNMIGSAYSIVKSVAENLKYILHVSANMPQLIDMVDFKQTLVTGTLSTVGQTVVIPMPAGVTEVKHFTYSIKKLGGTLYPEVDCPVEAAITGTNLTVTLDADASVSFEGATINVRIVY